eukprot:2790304-Pleurochrysis_carterae.AAC.1
MAARSASDRRGLRLPPLPPPFLCCRLAAKRASRTHSGSSVSMALKRLGGVKSCGGAARDRPAPSGSVATFSNWPSSPHRRMMWTASSPAARDAIGNALIPSSLLSRGVPHRRDAVICVHVGTATAAPCALDPQAPRVHQRRAFAPIVKVTGLQLPDSSKSSRALSAAVALSKWESVMCGTNWPRRLCSSQQGMAACSTPCSSRNFAVSSSDEQWQYSTPR